MNLGSLLGSRKSKKSKQSKKLRDELLQFIVDRYVNHPLRGGEHTKRALYSAWYNGDQDMKVAYKRQRTVGPDEIVKHVTKRHLSRINILKPDGKTSIAKVMKEDPTPSAVPMGSNNDDVETARIVQAIFDHVYERPDLDIQGTTYSAMELAWQHGTGWKKIIWNDDAYIYDLEKKDWFPNGDIDVQVLSDFEVYPDARATDWFKMRYLQHAYMANVEDAQEMYPEQKDSITAFDQDEDGEVRSSYTSKLYDKDSETKRDKCLVIEHYERPCEKYPKGRLAVVINKSIIAGDIMDNPYAEIGYHLSIPIIPWYWDKSSTSMHGTPPIKDLLPIQYEFNKVNTLTYQNIKKTGANMFVAMKGSGLKDKKMADMPGNIIETNDGRLNAVAGPPEPSYIRTYADFLISMRQHLSNAVEANQGQLPSGGSQMSGLAFKQITDASMLRQAPEMRALKVSKKLEAQLIIGLYQKHAHEKRFIEITNRESKSEIIAFSKADLVHSFDIKIPVASAMSASPGAKSELSMSLYEQGILPAASQGDPAALKVLDVLEFGQMEEITQMRKMHRNRAERHANAILEAEVTLDPVSQTEVLVPPPPDIYPVDDHKIHLEVLTKIVISIDFEILHELKKNAINMAIQEHMNFLQPPMPEEGAPPGGGEGLTEEAAAENMVAGPQVSPERTTRPEA
jgi:hypothetical protein